MTAKNVEDVYELTPMQQGMLFHTLVAHDEGFYIEQAVLTLTGPLDRDPFWWAWQVVVDRHPALRSTFHWDDITKPVQAVHARVVLARDERDWRGLSAAAQDAALDDLLSGERRRGLDLERAPIMRVSLCRVADERFHVALRFSHLVVDGWSVGIALGEFSAAYRARRAGTPLDLAPAVPFRDYVGWWKRADRATAEPFWRDYLAGYTPPAALSLGPVPVLPPTPGARTFAWCDRTLADLAPDLRAFSHRAHVTLHTLVQSAWALVLSRCQDTEDLTVGTTFAHRPADLPGVESIVGCLVGTLPVRSRPEPARPVAEWLRETQDGIIAARDHAGASLVDIQEWSAAPAASELFETIVGFQNMPLPAFTLGADGLALEGYALHTRPHTALVLMVLPGADLPLHLVYDARRFDAPRAELLLSRLRSALASILAHPGGTVGDLDVLAGEERAAVLAEPADGRSVRDRRGRPVPLGVTGELYRGGVPTAGRARRELDGSVVELAPAPGPAHGPRGGADAGPDAGPDIGPDAGSEGTAPAAGPATVEAGTHTETERALAALFADMLRVERVAPHDNLVELGLHSLLGTRAVNRIKQEWKTPLPLRVLFERPTVAALAATIEAGGVPEEPQAGRGGRVDVVAEAVLDPAITPPAVPLPDQPDGPHRVLLTGATGYLGGALLERLLRTTACTVVCLVRSLDPAEGARRVRDAAAAAGRWDDAFADRIEVQPGNLAQQRFGLDPAEFDRLAGEVDEIYHLGAVVNILPAYRRVRPTNVAGTQEILRLAAVRGTPVHAVSPAEVTDCADPGRRGREARLRDDPPHLYNGYIQSKWVADRILGRAQERGLPVVISRAARLVGSPQAGRWKLGDVVGDMARAAVHLGLVPDSDVLLPVSTVDHVAAGIAALARTRGAAGGQYHLTCERPFRFADLAEALAERGYPVRTVPLQDWYAELVRLSQRDRDGSWDLFLSVLGPWVRATVSGWREPLYATDRARALLRDTVACPRVDADFIAACLDHFAAVGLIRVPAGV